ncbi:MAG: hypothetical protein ACE5H7_13995 [Acidiferrobacterales bacterium]
MAGTGANAFVGLGNILPVGMSDLTEASKTPKMRGGMVSFMNDSFGLRIFKYVRCLNTGGMTKDELMARVALVTGTVTAASGETNDTTHLSDTGNFTADNETGKVGMINVAGAAAPEGECYIILSNTADTATMDPNYALTAAPASGDTYSHWGLFHGDDAAAGDNKINIHGVLMASPALRDYCWAQMYGFHPQVAVNTATALTADQAVVAAAVGIDDLAAETEEDWVGWTPMATSASVTRAGAFIDVWESSQPIA